jgi:hypothetical protein
MEGDWLSLGMQLSTVSCVQLKYTCAPWHAAEVNLKYWGLTEALRLFSLSY